jgi:acyl dehydratase
MTFATPVEDRYFEDYVPGAVHEFGSIVAEETEMIEFARRFDPQPFHTDPEAAKKSVFGGHVASLSSPGVDQLRWVKPVRPGDVLCLRVTVSESKRSRSKPDRGIVHSYVETLNQNGEVIMSMKATNLLACREIA